MIELDTTQERLGNWIETYSAAKFWPMDPRPEEVRVEDIAHSLSLQCRYSGHTKFHYSVAQHSLLVAVCLPTELKLWGLMHDAAEAYLVDLPSPIKSMMPEYAVAEDNVLRAIAFRCGLTMPIPPEVKAIDRRILLDERNVVMSPSMNNWYLGDLKPLGIFISDGALSTEHVERTFLKRYVEYGGCA